MFTWWRHQMKTFSALLALCAGNSPVPGEFPSQRPVTRSFGVFFDLRLDKRLSKQSWGFRRYRAHYDVTIMTTVRTFLRGDQRPTSVQTFSIEISGILTAYISRMFSPQCSQNTRAKKIALELEGKIWDRCVFVGPKSDPWLNTCRKTF